MFEYTIEYKSPSYPEGNSAIMQGENTEAAKTKAKRFDSEMKISQIWIKGMHVTKDGRMRILNPHRPGPVYTKIPKGAQLYRFIFADGNDYFVHVEAKGKTYAQARAAAIKALNPPPPDPDQIEVQHVWLAIGNG